MKPKHGNKPDTSIRAAAEAQLAKMPQAEIAARPAEEVLHELRVHQIELEMQNETLRQAQLALEKSRDSYIDLYEFAPVGYLTLTAEGMIAEINLTCATLLGRERNKLLKKSLRSFVVAEDQDKWVNHFIKARKQDEKDTLELALQRGDGTVFQAQLDIVTNESLTKIALTDISERKQLLIEREHRYAIVDKVVDPLFVKDNDHRIVFANRAFYDLFGLDESAAKGKTLAEHVPEQERKQFLAVDRGVLDTGISDLREETLTLAGITRFIVTGKTRFVDSSGEKFLVGSIHDITEIKQSEQALQKNEERMRLSMNAANQSWFEVNVQTGKVEIGEGYHDMLGFSLEEFHTSMQNWFDHIHPDDLDVVKRTFQACIASGEKTSLEYRRQAKNGEWKWIGSVGKIETWDESGKPLMMMGVHTDITERKQIEAALENIRELYAETELIGKVGGWEFDIDTGKQTWTEEVYRIHELDLNIDLTVDMGINFYTPESRPIIERAVKRAIEYGESFDVELEIRTAKGNLRSVHAIGKPNLEHRRIHGFFQDITDMKLAEQKQEASAAHLQSAMLQAIEAIAATLEMRDPYTAGHQRRVADLSKAIAIEMGLDEDRVQGLFLAASIHDIGKVNVPAEILVKPTRLSDIEMGLVKVHAQSGYDILKDMKFPWPIADMVRQHHERLDGSGYPQGLKGDQIMLEGRIMVVADVMEAMSTDRPYRPGLGLNVAMAELTRGKGDFYDAAVVEAVLRVVDNGFKFSE